MKNILTGAGLSLLMGTVISLGSASVSFAQESNIEPESVPGNYGLVRSYNGENLEVRMLDGTEKSYTVPEGTSAELKKGDLVGFDVDDAGMVSSIQPPAVDEVIRGTVTDIDVENQTVTVLPEGGASPVDTRISESMISKLALEPGKEVMVTKYANSWASKVCLPKAAAPAAAPPVEEPIVPADSVEEPSLEPAAEPIPALW